MAPGLLYLFKLMSQMRLQQTISRPVRCTGIGLHSGGRVCLSLLPAPRDSGIVFIRKDIDGGVKVDALIKNIRPALLSTVVGVDGVQVQTTEHVLAAATGLGIDNLYIEVDAPELPVMDGSAAPFVRMILDAGIVSQDRHRSFLKIVRPVEVSDGDKSVSIHPALLSSITYTIDYDHPMIRRQDYLYHDSPDAFMCEIAPARTFGFLRDVEALWDAGLGLGGSLQNTLILSDEGLLNEDGLRFADEFVRHKILDLIGDMALLGLPFIGEILAVRSGHALHARLVDKILESRENWIMVAGDMVVPAGRMTQRAPAYVASPERG
jgi:UDP-3-O-[3-hydroxymyristoyl] N-acetylglucosamine deacetylase